ncbi:MAG: amidase [Alphaproteobacteria bacterium]|nr:amidase [Alphaproteobacteria bacterium]TAD90725.1 MAG: amidase [Alphaproteobacteria bacterium]
MEDYLGAFRSDTLAVRPGAASGPLSGLTFAAKDLFDVAGVVTGAGTPDFQTGRAPAAKDAAAVAALLAAGATLVGKTLTDELAFGLFGRNAHYGTPTNPAAPDRVPGGSSSGSAAAVAGGLVDLALGTDTGGSIRIPSSFCGLFGLRPTHGRISAEGVHDLAPSFDTVGLFARTGSMLRAGYDVLLPADAKPAPRPTRLLIATDMVARADAEVVTAWRQKLPSLAQRFAQVEEIQVAGDALAAWAVAFRMIQGFEGWQTDGAWISSAKPNFGADVRRRFTWAATVTKEAADAGRRVKADVMATLDALLGDDAVLALPTSPVVAPLRTTPPDGFEVTRDRIIPFTCLGGLSGLPQLSLPGARASGPVGLSLIGPRGADRALLALAADWSA